MYFELGFFPLSLKGSCFTRNWKMGGSNGKLLKSRDGRYILKHEILENLYEDGYVYYIHTA